MAYRSDYVGTHLRRYERIARGEAGGFSTEEQVETTLLHLAIALGLPESPRGGRLVELGCGDGCNLVAIGRRFPAFRLAGIDIVPLAVDLARRRAAGASVAVALGIGNVVELPFPAAAFDVVVDGHCLHCLVPDDRRRYLAEAHRVLRPGGLMFIDTMTDPPLRFGTGTYDAQTGCHVVDGVVVRTYLPAPRVLQEVEAAGFRVLASYVESRHDDGESNGIVLSLLV